jgi:UDP-glucuronate 4-epimerase
MKVLVTGAAGFIGAHLTYALSRRADAEILAFDIADPEKLKPCRRELLDRAGKSGRVVYTSLDLSEGEELQRLCEEFQPQCVIHAAALLGVRECRERPDEARRHNVNALERLLYACRDTGVERFVLLSSLCVYNTLPAPFREDLELPMPEAEYPRSRRQAELVAQRFADATHVPVTILRISNVYGPCQREDRVVHAFVHRILAGLPLDVQGDPENMRDYLYVEDCVTAVLRAMEPDNPPGIYNIGGNQPTSLADLIRSIEAASGKKADTRISSARGRVQSHCFADNSLAARKLGFSPTVSLSAGLERFIAWYRAS